MRGFPPPDAYLKVAEFLGVVRTSQESEKEFEKRVNVLLEERLNRRFARLAQSGRFLVTRPNSVS